jgi:hypothetical protein
VESQALSQAHQPQTTAEKVWWMITNQIIMSKAQTMLYFLHHLSTVRSTTV